MPMLFEQQPREGSKAFAAFKLYLDMGPERSLAAVARKLGVSKTTVAKWSRRNHWQERVAPQGKALGPSGSDPKGRVLK